MSQILHIHNRSWFQMTGTMEDRNHQCTCKTDQASNVLLKILSLLQAVEMLELFSFLQQTPWSPVRDRCRQISSPLSPALTQERLATASHAL